ncbi:LacI family transcriptional regulator [Puniceicoccaceae bacterium K14]|nr:LacI family transcriptional regulator [Puniceicoccaceae bacterium K14]
MSRPRSKRISQTQIAKELGFSQALVSMALNGRKDDISESTYKAIWNYALQHGYSPRGMRMDTANNTAAATTIGYILRSPLKLATKSNFFSHIHQGLYDYLDSRNIKTVFLGSEDDIVKETEQNKLSLPLSVKGIAIMGEVKPILFDSLTKLNKPIAYIAARKSGYCHSVLSNEARSAEFLVDHLISLGHRNFAWIGGNRNSSRFKDRLSQIQDSLRKHGIELQDEFIACQEGADRKEGNNAAKKILEATDTNRIPSAWICLNGLMARGAINRLYQSGYKVGEDISVAAFDMTNVCTEEDPSITCSGADPEQMGAEAARILMTAINGETNAFSDITLPSTLRVGHSTGALKVHA